MSRTSPSANQAFDQLEQAVRDKRCVVVVGLPATGKSALVRESARVAGTRGRRVHLLQWDLVRVAWDRPDILARFPEVDGVTHSAIRGAIGLWLRGAMGAWFREHTSREDLLLVEAPIIGGRFAELAKRLDDPLEEHLGANETLFVIVAPTVAVHEALRERRARETNSESALERHNASVGVVDVQLAMVEDAAKRLGTPPRTPGTYEPDLFVQVMQSVLRHRGVLVMRPDALIGAEGSVYDFERDTTRMEAAPDEVTETIRAVERDTQSFQFNVEVGWSLV